MRSRVCGVAAGVWCTFGAWWASAQAVSTIISASATADQTGLSQEAKRALATYAEIIQELTAQMAAGGKQTDRMTALEERLSDEVKVCAPELMGLVRTGDREPADAAAYALRYAPDPEAAVAPLLAGLGRFEGALSNNVCLALMYLRVAHLALRVPIEPLTEALHATEWNHQQKAAQVVEVLAQRGGVTDSDGSLAAALIPMLASQRVRVFRPAREILPKITGQSLGDAPEPWARWYAQKYGRAIDLAAGVYELVQIVRPAIEDGKEVYRVDAKAYATRTALLARLMDDADTARSLGRRFGVAIQVPAEGFPQDRLDPLAEALFDVSSMNLVVSTESDEFLPFATAVGNLRGLLRSSGPSLPR